MNYTAKRPSRHPSRLRTFDHRLPFGYHVHLVYELSPGWVWLKARFGR